MRGGPARHQFLGLLDVSGRADAAGHPGRHPDRGYRKLPLVGDFSRSATGELRYASGRVLNIRGEPVANAVLEVWQANAANHYTHPGDDSQSPLDSNFQGFARIRSGKDGGFRLKTIYPGAYGNRTRHVHFEVRGQRSRLVTQMYFEGEPRNEADALLKAHGDEDRKTLICQRRSPTGHQERDALVAEWNIVLAFGRSAGVADVFTAVKPATLDDRIRAFNSLDAEV